MSSINFRFKHSHWMLEVMCFYFTTILLLQVAMTIAEGKVATNSYKFFFFCSIGLRQS